MFIVKLVDFAHFVFLQCAGFFSCISHRWDMRCAQWADSNLFIGLIDVWPIRENFRSSAQSTWTWNGVDTTNRILMSKLYDSSIAISVWGRRADHHIVSPYDSHRPQSRARDGKSIRSSRTNACAPARKKRKPPCSVRWMKMVGCERNKVWKFSNIAGNMARWFVHFVIHELWQPVSRVSSCFVFLSAYLSEPLKHCTVNRMNYDYGWRACYTPIPPLHRIQAIYT